MKLYERFADKGFHTSVSTTFGIDFDAYENIALPRLRGAGCRNNIVIADRRMLTYALSGASALPRHAGRLYTATGGSALGVFHPKLFLQFGRRIGRLIVSSANLTASGIAGNLEILGVLECSDEQSGETRLIAQAWSYVQRHFGDDEALRVQLQWVHARVPWLADTAPADGAERLGDGTIAAVLATDSSRGIGERFAELVGEPVSKLIVVSPYWDDELKGLASLAERMSAGEMAVVVDPADASFPKEAGERLYGLTLYNRGEFRRGRSIHAKAIIALTANADHVLLGSANCTAAAIGADKFAGINEEVSLYRRLPPDTILTALELDTLLVRSNEIEIGSLHSRAVDDDIPFAELESRIPGRFEIRVDTLLWHPPVNFDDPCTIELLDSEGSVVAVNLQALASSTSGVRRYELPVLDEPPAFARLLYANGDRSAKAIINLVDRIRRVIRESASRKVDDAQRQLEVETDVHLSLLDILDVLEKIDDGELLSKGPQTIPRLQTHEDAGSSQQYRTLTYEDFIKGRRPRTAAHQTPNSSLEGSEVSIIRNFLNRILGLKAEAADQPDSQDEDLETNPFDLGDETDDAESALTAGEGFGTDQTEAEIDEQRAVEQRRQAKRQKATKDQISKAVTEFQSRIKDRRETGDLSNVDVLRLRALLMIVCSVAQPCGATAQPLDTKSELRVLPAEGNGSWPILIGRLIFAMFGGTDPAIHELILRSDHDQLPDDIVECWATCYWCLAAGLTAILKKDERKRVTSLLEPIAKKAYLLTLPSEEELLGEDIAVFMESMSLRYARGMNVDPEAIADRHRQLAKALFQQPSMAH